MSETCGWRCPDCGQECEIDFGFDGQHIHESCDPPVDHGEHVGDGRWCIDCDVIVPDRDAIVPPDQAEVQLCDDCAGGEGCRCQ